MAITVNESATKASMLCIRLGNVTQELYKRLDDVYYTAEHQARIYAQDGSEAATERLLRKIEHHIEELEGLV